MGCSESSTMTHRPCQFEMDIWKSHTKTLTCEKNRLTLVKERKPSWSLSLFLCWNKPTRSSLVSSVNWKRNSLTVMSWSWPRDVSSPSLVVCPVWNSSVLDPALWPPFTKKCWRTWSTPPKSSVNAQRSVSMAQESWRSSWTPKTTHLWSTKSTPSLQLTRNWLERTLSLSSLLLFKNVKIKHSSPPLCLVLFLFLRQFCSVAPLL